MDVIKVADYIIDLGPEGGDQGGEVLAQGSPEIISETPGSYTGVFLKEVLGNQKGYRSLMVGQRKEYSKEVFGVAAFLSMPGMPPHILKLLMKIVSGLSHPPYASVSFLRILPTALFGNSFTNSTYFGTLYLTKLSLQ